MKATTLLPPLVVLTVACGAPSPTPSQVPSPTPVAEPTPSAVQPAPFKYEVTLDIVDGEVRLNGVVVERTPQEQVVKLEGLQERLRQLRREHAPEACSLRFLLTDDLTVAAVFSIQQTAASSGFWRMKWMSDSGEVEILTRVPGRDFDEQEKHQAFVSLEPGNEEFTERFARAAEEGDPPQSALRHPEAAKSHAELVRAVEQACRKSPCGALMLESAGSVLIEHVRPVVFAAATGSGPLLLSVIKPDGAKDTSMRLVGNKSRPPGRLAAEVIQDAVRARYAEFQACYRQGLTRNPRLRGTVSVRFLIAEDGRVESVSKAGGDLSDEAVVRCVHDVFAGLRFPAPEGGVVSVVYPFAFDR